MQAVHAGRREFTKITILQLDPKNRTLVNCMKSKPTNRRLTLGLIANGVLGDAAFLLLLNTELPPNSVQQQQEEGKQIKRHPHLLGNWNISSKVAGHVISVMIITGRRRHQGQLV